MHRTTTANFRSQARGGPRCEQPDKDLEKCATAAFVYSCRPSCPFGFAPALQARDSACARARSPSERLRRRAARKSWARRGARTALRGLLLIGISGVALAQLWPWLRPTGSQEAPAQPGCAAWDREASEGIAELVFDGSAAAEWKLDQAIVQLRRARKHCRSGSVQAALHDYASLHRSLPFLTGSIRPHGKNGSTSGQQAIPSDP